MRSTIFFGLLLTACQQEILVRDVDPFNPSDVVLISQQGEQLFFQKCEGCHAAEGAGSQIAFQVLNPNIDYAQFVIREGRDDNLFPVEMPDYDNRELSDDEMNSIIVFLRQAEKPTDGAGLYKRFCENCHGADAQSGPADTNIANEDADDFFEKIREGEGDDPSERDEFMPSYSEDEISDAEINLIINFVSTL